MLRGSENISGLRAILRLAVLVPGDLTKLEPGDVKILVPAPRNPKGDIHQVTNAFDDRGSISIHVYGGNIGAVRHHTFDVKTGQPNLFVWATPTMSSPTSGTARRKEYAATS